MRLVVSWLRDWVDIEASPHEIALLHAYLGRALDDAQLRTRAEELTPPEFVALAVALR